MANNSSGNSIARDMWVIDKCPGSRSYVKRFVKYKQKLNLYSNN